MTMGAPRKALHNLFELQRQRQSQQCPKVLKVFDTLSVWTPTNLPYTTSGKTRRPQDFYVSRAHGRERGFHPIFFAHLSTVINNTNRQTWRRIQRVLFQTTSGHLNFWWVNKKTLYNGLSRTKTAQYCWNLRIPGCLALYVWLHWW